MQEGTVPGNSAVKQTVDLDDDLTQLATGKKICVDSGSVFFG